MMAEMFLDTAYAIALSAPGDLYHDRAMALAIEIKATSVPLVTTRAIFLEIGNALSKRRFRQASVSLLDKLESDANVEILALTELLYARAVRLYRERPDKDWGRTDCVSFVVMQDRGIIDALTTDEHFQQAGFRALMRED